MYPHGEPLLLYGEGPAFTRAANASQTGEEGYFLDLAHKIATRGRQAAHRGVPFRITSPELAALFLLPVRKTASQSPDPAMLLQKSALLLLSES